MRFWFWVALGVGLLDGSGIGATLAHAETYPWISISDDDVRVLSDVRTDLALRLDLIHKARQTIDIAVYDVRPDKVITYPILYALRQAADRGVKVRILTSYIPQLSFDRLKHQAHYLMQPPTLVPIEYEVIGGVSEETFGWGPMDTIHEKFFMVDHEFLLTTGRGFGENYVYWLDTDYAVRGELARQSEQAFEATWETARHHRSPITKSLFWLFDRYMRVQAYTMPESVQPSPAQVAEMVDVEHWFMAKAPPGAHEVRARVLHHDFLHQLEMQSEMPAKLSIAKKVALLDDPVVDAVVDKLAGARDVRISALTFVLHPKLKAALVAAAKAGTHITMVTNTRAPSFSALLKSKFIPGGPIWDLEVPDLDDALQAGIDVRQFQTSDDTPWIYLHRKLAVIDDTVIFGSHNFNLPSTTYNDETSYEVESPRLAAEMRALFDRDLGTNSAPLDAVAIHSWRQNLVEKVLDDVLAPLVGIM